jgi:hypothetical protein
VPYRSRVIVTFYSYKGGVGRSMALANVADLLARSGLRVLIVDFDLEAPGLEHFFPIDHDQVRAHKGLLDLLLTFKYSMSTASAGEERNGFRRLDDFLTTIYPTRDGGGGIDLLPAGRRLTDEQIGRYGEQLRRFDWLDFYFSWSGELFFEWLRRTFLDARWPRSDRPGRSRWRPATTPPGDSRPSTYSSRSGAVVRTMSDRSGRRWCANRCRWRRPPTRAGRRAAAPGRLRISCSPRGAAGDSMEPGTRPATADVAGPGPCRSSRPDGSERTRR